MDIIVDIDGTIADHTHRQHYLKREPKDWDGFFAEMHKDLPISPIVNIVNQLRSITAYRGIYENRIIFCTGRTEKYREVTTEWLQSIFDQITFVDEYILYMRQDGDFRPDHIVKAELLAQIRFDGFNPVLAIEDRQSVVDMWCREGLTCLQSELFTKLG